MLRDISRDKYAYNAVEKLLLRETVSVFSVGLYPSKLKVVIRKKQHQKC